MASSLTAGVSLSLFRRLVTDARHDDDVAQIAEVRSKRLESRALPVDAEYRPRGWVALAG
jgi:hypothetical protein